MNQREDLPIFVNWLEFITWLLNATEKFPKTARFTLALRLENLALDIVEDLVEARYTNKKGSILKRANLKLEKLRILLRISHDRRYLSRSSYRHAMERVNETGKMLGGWIRQNKQL